MTLRTENVRGLAQFFLRSQTAIERARYVGVNTLVVRRVASRGKVDEHHLIMGRIHGKWEGKRGGAGRGFSSK